MNPTEQQLDLFDELSYYEGADVEYKSARGGLPGSLWETYSAFANTDSGTIWLGISQKDGTLDPHGVDDPEKLLSDLWSGLNNREKVSCNLVRPPDVAVVTLPGASRPVIAVRVPRASRRERPVYVGPHPLRGTYRRDFDGDYLCNEDEVRRMFADQSDDPADSRILVGFNWSDLHPESIRQFRNRFASRTPDHAWLREDDQGLLIRLGALRQDRATNSIGVTVAGLLMFGRTEAITAPEAIPGFHVDYRERFSEDPAIRWTDRLTPDGTWEANVFQFYQQVIVKLSTGPGIKQPFQRDAEGYRRQVTPVHEALQEALVNALIHSDYSGQGGIVIDRYMDRIEFSNPGTLLVSREQLLSGGVSECRNKSLQKMFQMLGVGDKAGSGIDKIRSSWAAQHWQSPRLKETRRPDRVRLELPMVSTLPAEAMVDLRHRFASALDEIGPDELQALVTAEVEGEVTNQRLQEMIALHRADITKMLRSLVRRGLLVSDGAGRGTRYYLGHPAASSPVLDPSSPVLDPSSPVLDPSSPVLGSDTHIAGDERVDESLNSTLVEIARPVREAGKVPRETVRRVILQLCDQRFLNLRELAWLLNRQVKNLRDDYIRHMVREGLLDPRFPTRPNHHNQAYRTRRSRQFE
jgi:ATP-dependent DNA helicase RecG